MTEFQKEVFDLAVYGLAALTIIAFSYRKYLIIRTKLRMRKIEANSKNSIPMTGSFVRHGMTFSDKDIVVPEQTRSAAYYKRIFRQAIS